MPPPSLGRRIELGSGPGFAREFIPGIELTDLVRAPWHDGEASAEALPFEAGSIGALVLFDVLHHVPSPRKFFDEAVRVLAPGGRIVMCEPYISPVSYPVYKLFHEEPLDMGADPLALHVADGARDPFDSNQGIPTLLFGRKRQAFTRGVSGAVDSRASSTCRGSACRRRADFRTGRFSPGGCGRCWHRIDARMPSALMRWMAFRMLVVLERA